MSLAILTLCTKHKGYHRFRTLFLLLTLPEAFDTLFEVLFGVA